MLFSTLPDDPRDIKQLLLLGFAARTWNKRLLKTNFGSAVGLKLLLHILDTTVMMLDCLSTGLQVPILVCCLQ
jgi:hypothetical protein